MATAVPSSEAGYSFPICQTTRNGQRKLVRTAADGSFRADGVPPGPHDGAVAHARFSATVEHCGQVVDVGTVEYPLVHPPTDAMAAFERFMQARLQRDDRAVLDSLTEELRTQLGGITPTLTHVSNPCWYRYQILGVDQPTPERFTARIRVYTHHWSGDNAGSLPQSQEQEVGMVNAPAGWRVDRERMAEHPRRTRRAAWLDKIRVR